MPEEPGIDERLRAVERALTDTDSGPAHLEDAAEVSERVVALTSRVERVEEHLEQLEGAVEALRGYVGHIDHVNEEVERRADAAIATVERLESAPRTPPRLATAQNPERTDTDLANRQGFRTADSTPSVGCAPGISHDEVDARETARDTLQVEEAPTTAPLSSRLRSLLERFVQLG
ncbi:MAG: hypothetical protein ABEJ27_03705 [Halodesulfurarchaeum sp.]